MTKRVPLRGEETRVKHQYTAIVERDRGWYVAHCVEIPGASGRGPTEDAAKQGLAEAIVLVLAQHGADPEEGARPEAPVVH